MGEQVTYSQSEAVEDNTSGNALHHLDKAAFDAVLSANSLDPVKRAELFAQMARYNTLYMVARAGSGHLGSSFSSLDLVSWLYLDRLREGDRYYSSKGHDAPGLYAVLTALGVQPFDWVHKLRRLDGLPGHPVVEIPGMETNTGSLGMGVSKAKGFFAADDLQGRAKGNIYVMTGDGELQEGQFWESLFSAGRLRNGRLTVIVDHNKIQSDTYVADVNDLGDLEAKFRAFGFECRRCDGNDIAAFARAVSEPTVDGRPLAIVADTIKGRGVAFMEHTAMGADEVYYRYHSGAPSPDDYRAASRELFDDIVRRCDEAGLPAPKPHPVDFDPITPPASPKRMIPAYTEALMGQAAADARIVALDADLVLDTGLIPFKDTYPNRFFECGISEMDMVSQAGTMALGGLLPVVHSFSCFLTTRPVEQIFNNWSERTKVVYVGSLAGVLPAGPGHSHQSVHDLTTMAGLPGFAVVEPFAADQIAPLLDWAFNAHDGSSYMRLTSVPYTHRDELAGCDAVVPGRGHVLRAGTDVTIVTTNAILTAEVLAAADILAERGIAAQVVATPWINLTDAKWYKQTLSATAPLVTVENHFVDHGFGAHLITRLAESGALPGGGVTRIGLTELPASGRNDEVLRHHRLDAASLADRVAAAVAEGS